MRNKEATHLFYDETANQIIEVMWEPDFSGYRFVLLDGEGAVCKGLISLESVGESGLFRNFVHIGFL